MIAGCGISGRAAARLASYMKLDYFLADQLDNAELRDFVSTLEYPPRGIYFSVSEDTVLPYSDICVLSPGIRRTSSLYKALEKVCGSFEGELEFAYRFLKCPALGITGTNGKTTTTELLTCILNAAGIRACAAGNIGEALSDIAIESIKGNVDVAALEISSFQLECVHNFKVRSGAILNIASDHLDRHGSIDSYAQIKFSLIKNLPPANRVINSSLAAWSEKFNGENAVCTTFSSSDKTACYTLEDGVIMKNNMPVFDFKSMNLKGAHNAENVMAALALASTLDEFSVTDKVKKALADFKPDKHRIELFLVKDGISYVNDSKATNPHSVNAALAALGNGRNIVILLGGLDKDMDFKEILPYSSHIVKACLYGECADKIYESIGNSIDCVMCKTFEDAVRTACSFAVSSNTVLLSPGAASMDMFRNYRHRGDCFKELIEKSLN